MEQQNYNDGLVELHSVSNIAQPGDKPKEGLRLKLCLRFSRRMVGISRYEKAMQNDAKVEALLRVQRIDSISTQDVAILHGKQYAIRRIQYPPDVMPHSMDLELSRLERDYAI